MGIVRRLLAVAVVVAAVLLGGEGTAGAHPLGNFTVNVSAAVVVGTDRIVVDYVVDHAEIPTVQVRREVGDGGGARCAELASGIDVRIDGRRTALSSAVTALTFPEGEAGLDTLRLECRFSAAAPVLADGETASIRFTDRNLADRLGWREVIAVGDRVAIVASDVPATSTTDRLRRYPDDRLASPLDQRGATVTVRGDRDAPAADIAGGGAGAEDGGEPGGLAGTLTSLVGARQLTVGVAGLAVLVAVALGALHALAPGHGKTIIAAYVVGQRGTLRQVVPLGLTVAVTHTFGVVVLGLVLWTSEVATPERLFPLLGMASGAIVAGIGISMLLRALRRRRRRDHHGHDHEHHGHHGHGHGDHHHDGHGHHDHHHHDHGRLATMAASELRTRDLLALGLAGGMVPTPSALLVLLGSLALGHAWFGVVLVLCYGVGMTATLIAAGLLLVRGWSTIERWLDRFSAARVLQVSRLLPVGSASVIVVAGAFLVARSALTV